MFDREESSFFLGYIQKANALFGGGFKNYEI